VCVSDVAVTYLIYYAPTNLETKSAPIAGSRMFTGGTVGVEPTANGLKVRLSINCVSRILKIFDALHTEGLLFKFTA
jgi:hypothetical protein